MFVSSTDYKKLEDLGIDLTDKDIKVAVLLINDLGHLNFLFELLDLLSCVLIGCLDLISDVLFKGNTELTIAKFFNINRT